MCGVYTCTAAAVPGRRLQLVVVVYLVVRPGTRYVACPEDLFAGRKPVELEIRQ